MMRLVHLERSKDDEVGRLLYLWRMRTGTPIYCVLARKHLNELFRQCVQEMQKLIEGEIIVAERETGTVKWFNTGKGYGFIEREQGNDLFVHYNDIRGEGHRSLEDGQQVEFVVVEGERGLKAEDVVVL